MKKGINRGLVFGVFFTLVLLGCVALIASMLMMSNKLRKFKVDMFVLCNEANICVSDGPDGQYRVSSENLKALNAILESTRGYFTLGTPEVTEQFDMTFSHGDDEWNLTIGRAGENKLMVDLRGSRNYKVYIKDNKKYPELLKCVSAEGYHEANKPITLKK